MVRVPPGCGGRGFSGRCKGRRGYGADWRKKRGERWRKRDCRANFGTRVGLLSGGKSGSDWGEDGRGRNVGGERLTLRSFTALEAMSPPAPSMMASR